MKILRSILLIALPLLGGDEWHVPLDADYKAILEEAKEDTHNGRFDEALAKYLWFQTYSIEHKPTPHTMYLSSAVRGLLELEQEYLEAKGSLNKCKNELASSLTTKGENAKARFRYYAVINHVLDEDKNTVDAFVALDENQPEVAKQVFVFAYKHLVRERKYLLCRRYIKPKATSKNLIEGYMILRDRPQEVNKSSLRAARHVTLERIASLIAVLVLNDEAKQARELVISVKKVMDSEEAAEMFDAALKGNMPPSYRSKSRKDGEEEATLKHSSDEER